MRTVENGSQKKAFFAVHTIPYVVAQESALITEPAKSSPMNPGGMKNSNEVSVGTGLLVLLKEDDATSEKTFAVSIAKMKTPSMFEVRVAIWGLFLSKVS